MDVQCERCKTEYEFDDALVSGRGTTVRCTNCGHQFKVRGGPGNGANDQWFVTTTEGRELTYGTLRDLQRAILAKQVARGDVLLRAGAPPRALASIHELEPFFEGRTSSRPPPAMGANEAPGGSVAFPTHAPFGHGGRSGESPLPPAARTPSIPAVGARPRQQPYGSVVDVQRRKMDTLRPPATGTAAPPQASLTHPTRDQTQPIVTAVLQPRLPPPLASIGTDLESEPSTRRAVPVPTGALVSPDQSEPLPPPTRPVRRPEPGFEADVPDMRASIPSSHEPYSVPRRGRVGGWVVAFVLMLAVGVVGWVVAKPYVVGRAAGAASQLDPRAVSYLSQGEVALSDGNLDLSKEDFDKASALAEGDPHVLLDHARLAAAQADIPWLKLRLLPAGANDEIRATKAQLDERVSRARRASDEALAIAPLDVAAVRTKIDALRLAGEGDVARGYVAKVIGQASQPETAYVLAALDLAEPEPLWTTVIERLRFAAAGEGNAGRARAALVYALAKSGDVTAAKAELAKLDALVRPYPLLPNLSALLEKITTAKSVLDAGTAASSVPHAESAAAPSLAQPGAATAGSPAAPAANPAGGGDSLPSDPRLGMQAAAQAERKGDWDRARQIYDAIVARNPSDSEALCGLGDVDRAQGNSAGAIATYRRAIAVNPSYLPALLGVADTQWITGDHGGAIRAYKDIVDRFPEGTYPGYVKQRTEGAPAAAAPPAPAAKGPTTSHAPPSNSSGEPSE